MDDRIIALIVKLSNLGLVDFDRKRAEQFSIVIEDFLAGYSGDDGDDYQIEDFKKGGKFQEDLKKLSGVPDIFKGQPTPRHKRQ